MDFWTLETLGLEAAALFTLGWTALAIGRRWGRYGALGDLPLDSQRRTTHSEGAIQVEPFESPREVAFDLLPGDPRDHDGHRLLLDVAEVPEGADDDRRVRFRKFLVIGAELGFER